MSGAYDQNLLHDAPELSRAQRQEGYTTDILNDQSRGRSPAPPPPGASAAAIPTGAGAARAATPHSLASDPEAGFNKERTGTGTSATSGHNKRSTTARTPFWRTTKGIIALVVLAVLLLGIIVGASVGATQSKKHKNNIAVDPRSSSSVSGGASAATPAATGAGGGQSQGVGGAPITSAVPGESGGGTGGENGATSAASSTRTRSGAAVQTAGPAVLFPVPTATGGTGNDGAGVGLSGIGNVFGTDQVST